MLTWQKYFFCCGFLLPFLLGGQNAIAVPTVMNYQGRILRQDNTPLSHAHVSFIFEVTSPPGDCVIYREQVTNVNISQGIFDVQFGKSHIFPANLFFTLHESFDNTKMHSCQNGSVFIPAADDTRLLKVQFHDGAAWREIVPHLVIGSVPYAAFSAVAEKSLNADRLDGHAGTAYLRKSEINNDVSCGAGDFLTWNAVTLSFGCATPNSGGGSSGTVTGITAGTGLTGGTISTAGTIGLGGPLLGLHNLASNGYIQRTGGNTYSATPASPTPGNNNLVMRDGSGVSGFYGVDIQGAISGGVLLQADSITTAYSLTFPNVQGTANQVLMTTGNTGVLTWANVPSAPAAACSNGDVISYNGTTFECVADQQGSAGGGIATISGDNSASHALGIGTAGTGPSWAHTGSGVHTLHIPLAASGGVMAGLISKAQYDIFSNKLSPTNNLSELTATASTARGNLGLGTVATLNVGTTNGTIPMIGPGDKLLAALIPDIAASAITNTPSGGTAALTVQAAINELDSEKVNKNGDIMTGTLDVDAQSVSIRGTGPTPGEVRLGPGPTTGTNYVGWRGPASNPAVSVLWQLPSADGSAGQVLSTDGAGSLGWSSGSIQSGVGLTVAQGGACPTVGELAKDVSGNLLVCDDSPSILESTLCAHVGALTFDVAGNMYVCAN